MLFPISMAIMKQTIDLVHGFVHTEMKLTRRWLTEQDWARWAGHAWSQLPKAPPQHLRSEWGVPLADGSLSPACEDWAETGLQDAPRGP